MTILPPRLPHKARSKQLQEKRDEALTRRYLYELQTHRGTARRQTQTRLAELENAAAMPNLGPDGPYWNDPQKFVEDFLPAMALTPYQGEVMGRLARNRLLAVRASRGAGKTAFSAAIVLWFAITRDWAGVEWKIITTASVDWQLKRYLWPEINKWGGRVLYNQAGAVIWERRKHILTQGINGTHGEASSIAPRDAESIEGAHADHFLGVFDESKNIRDAVWDSAKGWFTRGDIYWLAVSTPGRRTGRFYDIFTKAPGYEHWDTRHVTIEEAVAAGQVEQSWVDEMLRSYGSVDHPFYRQQVLGEFADINEAGVIPLEWIEAAHERWHNLTQPSVAPFLGIDMAEGGADDATVVAPKYGPYIAELLRPTGTNLMDNTGRVRNIIKQLGASGGWIDAVGVGAGTAGLLAEEGLPISAYKGSQKTDRTDRTGNYGFANTRSAAYWNVRELLNPLYNPTLALPPDVQLTADLAAPSYDYNSSGKIKVQPKDKVTAELGRSPDAGDAVVMACWQGEPEKPVEVRTPQSNVDIMLGGLN